LTIAGLTALALAIAFPALAAPGMTAESGSLRMGAYVVSHEGDARRECRFVLENIGPVAVMIAKPMFPTAWSVKRTFKNDGVLETEEHSGGLGRGKPSSGHPDKYHAEDYELIAPGSNWSKTLGPDFYLKDSKGEVKSGEYLVEFVYWYEPTPDEADLPLFSGNVRSNPIALSIPD